MYEVKQHRKFEEISGQTIFNNRRVTGVKRKKGKAHGADTINKYIARDTPTECKIL